MLRPQSDFTITHEVIASKNYVCVARPTANRWETHNYGETVKKCSRHEVIINDRYVLDSSATFPDGAICGTREPANDRERQIFGETVRVCNQHPDPNDPGTSTLAPGPSGSTHTGDSHQVAWGGTST